MKDFTELLGDRIRYYRTSAGMTQEVLADQTDLHVTYIGKIERGEKNVSILILDRILDALNVTYQEFFEPLDVSRKSESLPLSCYELIREQPHAQQKRILKLLEIVIAMTDA